jgi:hypothetical protein
MRVDGITLIATAQRQIAELEAAVNQAVGSARASLAVVEEENRELRRESMARSTSFYTEREFAALLKVSVSTIARLRRAAKLEHLQVGSQIRYSSVHIERAHELFSAGRKASSGRLKSFR